MTGPQVLADQRRAETMMRDATDEDRRRWVERANFARTHDGYLPYLKEQHPDKYRRMNVTMRVLAVRARFVSWRHSDPTIGGRPEQLLPGTPGSSSTRTDWRIWLLMGGRGSGKSRTGAEAIRELLFGTKWTHNPRVGFVGRTLDAVRTEMFINTFLMILPPGCIVRWKSTTCELWVDVGNGRTAYIKGYTAERPDQVRGPNLHLVWADEIAGWKDADRSPGAPDTTWSNMNFAVRAKHTDVDGKPWQPRIIATTTPKAVRLLSNPDPDDYLNPGAGIHDNEESTVVSSMSTLDNLENLAPFFYESAVKPFEGTALYDQEVLGHLIMEVVGALWSSELLSKMFRPVYYPERQGEGLVRIIIAVDPSVGEGVTGDECGIIVAGLAADNNVYILEDGSLRADVYTWALRIKSLARTWDVDSVIAEANQGHSLVAENLWHVAPNLPIESVHAKRGKRARAEPVSLLSKQRRVFFAGDKGNYSRVTEQLRTWDGTGESPDRLDALVYAVMYLLPADAGMDDMVSVTTPRPMR